MSTMTHLRLADLRTLLVVQRTGSISAAAREVRVTPSQVSKAIARMERYFGVRLLRRAARGISPTEEGRKVLARVARAVDELSATVVPPRGERSSLELTIAAPSYLASAVLPQVVSLLPTARVRVLEFVPAQLRAWLAENVFDVAVIPGGCARLPDAWAGELTGFCRSGLLARPAFAKRLGSSPLSADRVQALPFVGPVRAYGDRIVTIDDDCPLAWEKRWIAHEAQTIGAALEFVACSDHVLFAPVLAARRLLAAGVLVEVPVAGWEVREPVHVLCNGERVLSRVRDIVVRAVRSAIIGEVSPVSVHATFAADERLLAGE
jgi:DNA-binding transcriptional LysR family regulator